DIGNFTGSLLPRSQFIVAPKIAGRLEKVMVDIGDEVEFNQLIAVIDDQEYARQADKAQAEFQVSRASLEEARSSMEVARREFERAKALYDQQIASEAEYDLAMNRQNAQKARYEVALAQVDQNDAAWKEAQVRLSYTRILAAWEEGAKQGGKRVVGERFRDEGSMLNPNSPIVSILDISTLLAVIHVIERDYPKVKIGMEATLTTDAYPGRVFTGKVTRIAPLLVETSRQARMEIEIPNQARTLKPGMFARVEITFGVHKDATLVPAGALVRRNEVQGVFLADLQNNTASFVPVTVGIISGGQAEVLEPQITGRVVYLGQHLLEDGAPIKVAEEGS
ncbi:MAG TPA: efflux RND transporter periplasmic adaptor subunit, partial [Candidatus Glassbacteria bacterium]|nr:efflux RND transporter periplasmic adaptor subunit [Candidatus Glassbacteria bacterium]